MPSVFDLLGHDHDEVKQMLNELAPGLVGDQIVVAADLVARQPVPVLAEVDAGHERE